MIREQESIAQLPKKIDDFVTSRDALWRESKSDIEVCEQMISQNIAFKNGNITDFPNRFSLNYSTPSVHNELNLYSEIATKITSSQENTHSHHLRINILKEKIKKDEVAIEQILATKRRRRKIFAITLTLFIAIGVGAGVAIQQGKLDVDMEKVKAWLQ